MARQPRFFVPGEVLHVIQRGNNRGPIFASEGDYRFFLGCLNRAIRLHEVFVHAYPDQRSRDLWAAGSIRPGAASGLPPIVSCSTLGSGRGGNSRGDEQELGAGEREVQTAYRGPFRASVRSYANGPTYQD